MQILVEGPPCTKNTRDCPTQQDHLKKTPAEMASGIREKTQIRAAEKDPWNIIRRLGAETAPALPSAGVRAARKFASAGLFFP